MKSRDVLFSMLSTSPTVVSQDDKEMTIPPVHFLNRVARRRSGGASMMCTGEGQGTQVRVLVADWDRNHALSLAAAMHRAGLNTSTAFNGKEAIAKAGTFRPHFLITEAYLGRLSGIHAAARINAALPDCKVILMSGEASFAGIANVAPEVVVYTCEQKPVDPIHLLEAITLMLSDE